MTRILLWLALATCLAGLGAIYVEYRPTTLMDGYFVLRDRIFAPAAEDPLVILATTVAIVAWFSSLDRDRSSLDRDRSSRSRPAPSNPRRPLPQDHSSDSPAPKAAPQLSKARLEAALEGRPDIPVFVERLLEAATLARASDIHLQPLERTTRVSFRSGGVLNEVAALPQAHHQDIVRRLKVLAHLVPYESRKPQDGRFTFQSSRGAVDLRMSVVPTSHGEKVVLRLMRIGEGLLKLSDLGLDEARRQRLEALLEEPQGVIVLTGPTGSGKTTSLYAAMDHIHCTRGGTTQLNTLEDPIEIELPFASQTQVQRAAGLDFHEALRSVLRQDPDILMVGEIRDPESAHIAIQAGLSGHLILTSLHADSAVGVFPRLIDLGIEPFLAASAILATVSQRLVRRLCPDCRRPKKPSRDQTRRLTEKRIPIDGLTFYVSEGCRACDGSGFGKRTAIFEVLKVSSAFRQEVTARTATDRLAELARREGNKTLLEAAVEEAARGRISLEEALRVTA